MRFKPSPRWLPALLVLGLALAPGRILAAAPPGAVGPAPPSAVRADGVGPEGAPRLAGALDLEAAVRVALQNSLQIALTHSETRAARATVVEAGADNRLKVSLGGWLAFQNMPMTYAGAPGVDPTFISRLDRPGALDLNLMAMLPLFTGGELQHRLQAAREGEKVALARVSQSLVEVARDTRVAYFQLLSERARLQVAQWQRSQLEEAARIAREQLKAGRVARFVLLRAEAELAAVDQAILDAGARTAAAEARLKRTLGVAQSSALSFEETAVTPAAAPALEEDLRTALEGRPDLAAARAGVAEAAQRVAEARSRYAPRGYLVGMYEGNRNGPFNGPFDSGYSAGLVVTVPVVDGGTRRAGVDRARADADGRSLALRSLQQEAARQVVEAHAELDAARGSADLSRVEVQRAEEDLRIARVRFQLGRSIHLELLDAVAAAARARLNQAAALYRVGAARATLLYATGRY